MLEFYDGVLYFYDWNFKVLFDFKRTSDELPYVKIQMASGFLSSPKKLKVAFLISI